MCVGFIEIERKKHRNFCKKVEIKLKGKKKDKLREDTFVRVENKTEHKSVEVRDWGKISVRYSSENLRYCFSLSGLRGEAGKGLF